MKTLIAFILFILPSVGIAQQVDLVTPLQNSLIETSGLILLNDRLITHNDSGNAAELYEIDTTSGNISRTVVIENASNVDWEDLCYDDTYIYIADFGNNAGNRTNLRVYRVSISDYLSTPNDTISADTILFNYADQTDFTATTFSTNYDAEALVSYNDSLYIFTKNWGNMWTNIYALPKTPGNYALPRIDSINVEGLVTGGSFNASSNSIMLSCYTFTYPFIVEISNLTSSNFSSASIDRTQISLTSGYSYQLEGIAPITDNNFYISTEESFSGASGLFRLNIDATNSLNDLKGKVYSVYPNPAKGIIKITAPKETTKEIYSINGELVLATKQSTIDLSNVPTAVYILHIRNQNGKILSTEKLIVL